MALIEDDYKRTVKLLQELDDAKSQNEVSNIERELETIRKRVERHVIVQDKLSYIPYPEISSEAFYNDLLGKKEFRDNRYTDKDVAISGKSYDDIGRDKCSLKEFNLTPNQRMIKNFLSPYTPYNGILLFHGVGVGKTCTAISIAEQYLDDTNKKKVLVLTPSTLLKDNFKTQIFDAGKQPRLQCVGSKYAAMIPNRSLLSKEAIEKKISRIIASRYKFMGLIEFANDIDKIRKDIGISETEDEYNVRFHQRLQKEFSDYLIIIDEVHNLRLDSEATKKRVPPLLELVLKKVQNTKLVLLTATPMFNDPKEIVYLLNLLLHNDKRPPVKISDFFDKRGNLKEGADVKLKRALQGYVSYMGGNNPYTFPIRLYPSINNDNKLLQTEDVPHFDIKGVEIDVDEVIEVPKMEIIVSGFTGQQRTFYRQAEKVFIGEDAEHDENSFNLQVCMQVSNILYPVSNNYKTSYGEGAFWGIFERVRARSFSIKYKDEHSNLLSKPTLAAVSCKIATILEYVKQSEGIVFIYSNWKWSGVLPLAIALEHIGFNKHGGRNILYGNASKPKKNIGNYIILSGDKDLSPDNDAEIQAVKAVSNIHGENIKVILATSVATEGIDFKCIREIHLMEPWFHMNKVEQIIGRAVRNCSHILLEPKFRNVTIYQHAASLKGQRESIDLRMYRLAYLKQRRIRIVEKSMQQSAIDCSLNVPVLEWKKDILNTHIPVVTSQGTIIESYQIGNNKSHVMCDGGVSSNEDKSTFNVSFYNDIIPQYTTHIIEFFKFKLFGTYNDISDFVKSQVMSLNSDVLKVALDVMLKRRDVFQNSEMLEGFLIYYSDKYIFHPVDTSSIRKSINSRANTKRQTQKSLKIEYKEADVNDRSSSFDYFKQQITEVRTLLNIDDMDYIRLESVIYDFVVDRLPKKTFLDICALAWENERNPFLKGFLSSLVRGNMILRKATGEILFVVSAHNSTNVIHTLAADGSMRPASDLQLKENKDALASLKPKALPILKSFAAYMTVNDDGTSRFKILQKDKESLGYICDQTSTLNIQLLKSLIDDIDTSLVSRVNNKRSKLPDKKCLCKIYEIALRLNESFARPSIANLIISSRKKMIM